MTHFTTGWRYYWRRYLGWFPIQFCMVCGKWYWGGLPEIEARKVVWLAWWKDYCSTKCADEDTEAVCGPPRHSSKGIIAQLEACKPLVGSGPLVLDKLFESLYAIKRARANGPQWCVGWDVGKDYSSMVGYWLYSDGRIEIASEVFFDERSFYEKWISKHPLAP